MAGYFEGLVNRGATPALAATWSFTLARHKVIAENVANMSTPGYKAKRLDYGEFQRALGEAMEKRGGDPNQPLLITGSKQCAQGRDGRLRTAPTTTPARNALFHDGTNMSIEQEMSELASNAMLHEVTTTLLDGRFEGLKKAIRGRV